MQTGGRGQEEVEVCVGGGGGAQTGCQITAARLRPTFFLPRGVCTAPPPQLPFTLWRENLLRQHADGQITRKV